MHWRPNSKDPALPIVSSDRVVSWAAFAVWKDCNPLWLSFWTPFDKQNFVAQYSCNTICFTETDQYKYSNCMVTDSCRYLIFFYLSVCVWYRSWPSFICFIVPAQILLVWLGLKETALKSGFLYMMPTVKICIVQDKTFLTQQYRLFSNYSASLQVDICYSDYTQIEVTMLGTRQLLFVGIRYVVDSPKPLPGWCCGKIWFCRSSYGKRSQ
jgi:hypothetical protein